MDKKASCVLNYQIELGRKLQACFLQDEGHDKVEPNLELGFAADARDCGIGSITKFRGVPLLILDIFKEVYHNLAKLILILILHEFH